MRCLLLSIPRLGTTDIRDGFLFMRKKIYSNLSANDLTITQLPRARAKNNTRHWRHPSSVFAANHRRVTRFPQRLHVTGSSPRKGKPHEWSRALRLGPESHAPVFECGLLQTSRATPPAGFPLRCCACDAGVSPTYHYMHVQ